MRSEKPKPPSPLRRGASVAFRHWLRELFGRAMRASDCAATSMEDNMFKAHATVAGLFLASALNSVQAADVVIDLPAGLACAGFDLRIEITGNPNRVSREFTDKSGNVVRLLTAGKGSSLSFTNLSTGSTLALRPNGAVEHIALLSDGSQQWTTTGHNVLILFPTDVPAGPSTTLYIGRVSFTVDTTGVFTLGRTAGRSADLCAALSG